MAEAHAAEPTPETPAKRGPGIMTLVKGMAIVSVIVLLEVAAATFLIPSASETRAIAQELASGAKNEAHDEHADDHGDHGAGGHDAHDDHGGHGGGHGGSGAHGSTREVNLGTYHIVAFNPSTQTSMSIDFELFGIVLAAEEEEFLHLFAVHEKRLNEQVTIAIRGMEAGDFTDPGLGLIKRVILEKTNRALGKPLVREAVFSEFSFMER